VGIKIRDVVGVIDYKANNYSQYEELKWKK